MPPPGAGAVRAACRQHGGVLDVALGGHARHDEAFRLFARSRARTPARLHAAHLLLLARRRRSLRTPPPPLPRPDSHRRGYKASSRGQVHARGHRSTAHHCGHQPFTPVTSSSNRGAETALHSHDHPQGWVAEPGMPAARCRCCKHDTSLGYRLLRLLLTTAIFFVSPMAHAHCAVGGGLVWRHSFSICSACTRSDCT